MIINQSILGYFSPRNIFMVQQESENDDESFVVEVVIFTVLFCLKYPNIFEAFGSNKIPMFNHIVAKSMEITFQY